MWQRVQKQISFTSTSSDPQQKQIESVSMLVLWKMFSGKVENLGSILIISIKTLKVSLLNHVVKSLEKNGCWDVKK